MNAKGTVLKYGSDIDTDVIIPARYLNTSDPKELASHCMEDSKQDINAGKKPFAQRVQVGDILVADKNFGCGSSREHAPLAIKTCGVSCVIQRHSQEFSIVIQSTSVFLLWNALRLLMILKMVM